MRLTSSALLGSLCLAIACRLANAETAAAHPLTIKEAVQLAMKQSPQRLIARLVVNEREKDSRIRRKSPIQRAQNLAAAALILPPKGDPMP